MAEYNFQEPLDKEYLIKNYTDLNFGEVEDELQCKRCSRVLIHNYQANCGHFFCRNCKDFLTRGTGWKCPTCQTKIVAIETNNWDIENRVLELQVRCINSKYGCEQVTALKDLKSHHDICTITKELNLPVLIRRPEKLSKVIDKIGELANDIHELRSVLLESKDATDKRFEKERKHRNLHKKDFDVKFTNLEHKVNGIGSQLTETIQTFKQSTNLQVQAEINKLSVQHNDIKKSLNELKNQQNAFQNQIAAALEKALFDLRIKVTPLKAINILLMGESGSGKSTLINSFANYCKYDTFDESKLSQDKSLINTKITVTDENYEEFDLTTGENDSNECMEKHQSSTLACKSYLFPLNDYRHIRLIDSAGFASTMGPSYDEVSVEDIVAYLRQYEDLHAVAIVMKGNESRITTRFDYCLQQILTIFHKSAAPNIIFIFTHTGTDKVAESMQTIKTALEAIEKKSSTSLSIKSYKKNVFCFENKGFNSVIAVRKGIAIDAKEIVESVESWELAKTEFERFINQAIELEPFHVSETLRLNEIQVFIRDLNAVLNLLKDTLELQQNPATAASNNDEIKLAEALNIEQLRLQEGIEKCWKYIYKNSILYFNFAKQEYVRDINKTPDIAVHPSEQLGEIVHAKFVINSQENKLDAKYSDVEKLRKDLVLMNVYGSKLAYLFQLNNKKNKNVIIKEAVVKI